MARLLVLGLLAYASVNVAMLAAHHPDSSPGGGRLGGSLLQTGAVLSVAWAGLFMLPRRGSRAIATIFVIGAAAIVTATAPAAELPSASWFTVVLVGAPGGRTVTSRRRRAVAAAPGRADDLDPRGCDGLRDPGRAGTHPILRSCPGGLQWLRGQPGTSRLRVATARRTASRRFDRDCAVGVAVAGVGIVRLVRAPSTMRLVVAPVLLGGASVAVLAAASSAHTLTVPAVEVDPTTQVIWLTQCGLALVISAGIAARPRAAAHFSRRIGQRVMSATPDPEALVWH